MSTCVPLYNNKTTIYYYIPRYFYNVHALVYRKRFAPKFSDNLAAMRSAPAGRLFFFGLSLLPPVHQLFVTGEHHTIFYYTILYIPIYYNNTLIVNDERCFFFRPTGRIKIVKLSSTLQRYIAKPNILNYYYYCLKRRCTEVLIIITTTRSHNRSLGLKFIASTSHRRRRSIYIAVGPIFNGLPFYPFFFSPCVLYRRRQHE